MTARTRRSATSPACGACGTPLIRQFVEVLQATADLQPIPAGTDHQHRTPHRLIWCAPPTRTGTGPPRLRWILPSTHPPNCEFPHHADHQCSPHRPPADTTEQTPALF